MAEQILAYDPSTNLELVLDPVTGEQKTRMRFNVNASGVRYKGDPFKSFEAAKERQASINRRFGDQGPVSDFSRANLGSMAEGYDSSVGGVDVDPGHVGFRKSNEFSEMALDRAVRAPLGSIREDVNTGQIGAITGGDRFAGDIYGEQLQARDVQQYLGDIKQKRKDVLDAVLGAGIPVSGDDLRSALNTVEFTPDLQANLENELKRLAISRERSNSTSNGFGGGVLGGLGAIAGFASGGLLGPALGAFGAFQQDRKQGALDRQLKDAENRLLPISRGSGIDFSADVFSRRGRDLDSVIKSDRNRGGFRPNGGL